MKSQGHPSKPMTLTLIIGGLVLLTVLASRLIETPISLFKEAHNPNQTPAETISAWHNVFVGIEMCEVAATSPRPLKIHAARVDLHEPTIDFLVTPDNGDEPMDCGARTPSEFLVDFKCQLAINGSFFSPFAKKKGDPQDVIGLSMSRGRRYSPPNRYDALLIDRNRRAWIDVAPIDTSGVYHGLSGHQAILLDGEIVVDTEDPSNISIVAHPRSTIGITRDRRYLLLVTIDGRQVGYSEGTTLVETAEWMRRLGAHDALNLDGGGSTAMAIENPDGQPVVVNRPSGQYERRVANHLGVFARRLPSPAAVSSHR